jgi:hypothetical protein
MAKSGTIRVMTEAKNDRLDKIRETIRAFPTGPGVNLMKDAQDRLLCIGKVLDALAYLQEIELSFVTTSQLFIVNCILFFVGGVFAAPNLSGKDLICYLNSPKNAAGYKYTAKDNAGNEMHCVSVMDIKGQSAKYAAVYHTSYKTKKGGCRYQVNLAVSNDLINWKYIRALADNADMPKITNVDNGDWIILTHEQWMGEGANGESQGPCQIGFKVFHDANDLMNGTIRAAWIAGKFRSNLNGTPSFYSASLVKEGEYSYVRGMIGFHFWNGTRDVNARASFTRLGHPQGGTSWDPLAMDEYNDKFIEAGVTGNIGQRDTIITASGHYNIQEGNIGKPAASWDKWRLWLYLFEDDTLLQLAPVTHGGSTSFGNPSVSFVTRPDGKGRAIFISYFFTLVQDKYLKS